MTANYTLRINHNESIVVSELSDTSRIATTITADRCVLDCISPQRLYEVTGNLLLLVLFHLSRLSVHTHRLNDNYRLRWDGCETKRKFFFVVLSCLRHDSILPRLECTCLSVSECGCGCVGICLFGSECVLLYDWQRL